MNKKRLLIILGVILLMVMGISAYTIHERRVEEEARVEAEAFQVALTYYRLNYALGHTRIHPDELDGMTSEQILRFPGRASYRSLEQLKVVRPPNSKGIITSYYIILRMYYHQTDIYLSYELVIDYLSSEFEPDGTRRLYNNGKHPEIEAFVTWMVKGHRRTEMEAYFSSLADIFDEYLTERGCVRPFQYRLSDLSTQAIDAIARAEADPDYILDLTGLWDGCD